MLLKNGHLVDPSRDFSQICDVRIQNGKVEAIGKLIPAEAEKVIDCTGRYIFPGFVDLHVHFRDPGLTYKETLTTGARAAAAGGYTAVCPMPNTKPVTDSAEKIAELLKRAETECGIHLLPVCAVTMGQEGTELVDFAAVKKSGAYAVSEDGKSVMDVCLYQEGMKQAKEQGLVVLAHCEDKNLVAGGVIHAGKKAKELGLPGITNAVEDVITARDIFLAGETGAKLHLCHCSTKASVKLVQMAKELGIDVTAEVCPHHFAMCDEDIPGDDANYKMNPPLRTREDMLALQKGLAEGIMECISTDHAPHSAEEKANGFLKAPFGIVGLETAFALSYTTLVKNGSMSLMALIRAMSTRPAEIIGHKGGTLAEGAPADLVIADIAKAYEIDPETWQSKGHNSPFGGKTVYGAIEYTMVNGTIIYDRQQTAKVQSC